MSYDGNADTNLAMSGMFSSGLSSNGAHALVTAVNTGPSVSEIGSQ